MVAVTLAALLKASRSLQGHTLRDVEKATGLSNPYLCQLENEKVFNVSASVIFTLAAYMRMSPENVLAAVGIGLGIEVLRLPAQGWNFQRTKYCFAPCPPETCDCMKEST